MQSDDDEADALYEEEEEDEGEDEEELLINVVAEEFWNLGCVNEWWWMWLINDYKYELRRIAQTRHQQ